MAVPKNPLESFLWGAGGAALTPDEIARRREMEQALVAKTGIDTSPVGHWTQGLARVLGAAGGAYRRNRLDRQQGDVDDYNSTIVQSLLGGASPSTGGGSTMPMSGASGEIAATGPVQPIDMTGNEVFSSFIDAARSGVTLDDGTNLALTNPYGLAALAATGKAESGFDPGNVNRTWSDPSESGQAGTAGGILSWRGPRYQALAATGDLSPAGQARFFLNEDPALIAALNSAKSTEEAIGLMNNAWKFAGYDRPGGEAARRLAAAQGFLPSFQGGGEVAALTPEAAIDAVSPVGGSLADEVAEFEQTPAYSAQFPGMAGQTQQQPVGQMNTVAQALTGGQQNTSAINPAILQALADPRANAQTRQIAELLLGQQQQRQEQQAARDNWLFQQQYAQQQQNADPLRALQLEKGRLEIDALRNPRMSASDQLARERFEFDKQQASQTSDIKEYEFAKSQGYDGSFADFQQSMKKAGAASTNVTVGEGNKFYEALDKKNAETFSALSEEGMRGRSKIAQIDRLEQLLSQAPVGGGAALKLLAGEYGINTEGVSDLQAAQALINELVPQQRQPGSGPMSDADLALFKQSLPRVINQPDGNRMIIQTMRGITEYQVKMGEIADAVANREMTAQQGRDAIRNLANPLDGYTKAVRQLENDEQDEGVIKTDIPGVKIRRKN